MRKFQLGILRNLLKVIELVEAELRLELSLGLRRCISVSQSTCVYFFFFFLMCLEFCEIFPYFSLIDDLFAILMAKYPESP